jgi:fructose-1,6-bisphosphatase/inositol monophosphatase family enzyme
MEILYHPETRHRYDFMMIAKDKLGAYALQLIKQGITMDIKPDGTKVTSADIALNNLFLNLLSSAYPQDIAWGEEVSNSEKGDLSSVENRWLWHIDPIDGTKDFWRSYQNKNFTRNTSSVMIAGFAPGSINPTVSVVYNPFNEHPVTFSANPEGSYYSTSRIHRQIVRKNEGPKTLDEVERYEEKTWAGLPEQIGDIVLGARKIKTSSPGLVMGQLALGDIDIAYLPPPAHPHDITAGALIAHNAGAHVSNVKGQSFNEIDWRVGPLDGCIAAPNAELAAALTSKIS